MRTLLLIAMLCSGANAWASDTARFVETPYTPQNVVFDFYYSHPEHINSALYWIRSLLNPLTASPYDFMPEQNNIKVVVHGTEIVALAKKNYRKYEDAVNRMRYYAELGVEFKVCALAAEDFGYELEDFQEFVQVVPSAMTELVHWQMQGYAMLRPPILDKQFSLDEIR
jgi:intracellular sulfur oxidation DsrE/DsrF family protein